MAAPTRLTRPSGGGELIGTRRAATVVGPRRIEVKREALQDVAPGLVRVAVEGCGVCGSNVPVWEGRDWFSYPLKPGAPGHEAWGSVAEVGDDVTGVEVGQRVAMLAEDAFVTAVDVDAGALVPLPRSLDAMAFPGEAIGCGFNVAARSGFARGQRVAVIGVGFIGAIVTAIAARAGAHVVAISRRQFSLDIGTAMGAADAVAYEEREPTAKAAIDAAGGELFDVVIEAVGAQGPLDLAGDLTRERGRLVIAGFHQDGGRTVDLRLWNWRGIDVVNAHERDRDVQRGGIEAAVRAVDEGWFDPAPLLTHTYPLDQLDAAMDAMLERPDGFLKAVVTA